MNLIIGNILGLISSLIMVSIGLIKNKKKILITQNIQIMIYTFSNVFLGGYTGIILNIVNIFRNYLCYKGQLKLQYKIIISIISISLSLLFNNLGIFGLLPLLGSTLYLWFMNVTNIIKFKQLIIFTISTWLIYNIIIQSYTSVLFNIITIITNFLSIIKIKKFNTKKISKLDN